MRKVAFLTAMIAVLAMAAVAVAAQVNTYSVTAKVTGGSAGSKSKPSPVGVKFNYTVGEQSGGRPSPVSRYTIGFYGVRSNGGAFPTCTAASINAAQSDSGCKSGSKVGSGFIRNAAGATNDPTATGIKCDLNLAVYNSGAGKGALFLSGNPTSSPNTCAIAISQAIATKYVKSDGGGTALQFSVPPGLLHPIPGVDNAVVNVTSTIKKLSKTVKGKKVGYYESIACKGGKRPATVTFLTEAGQTSKATASAGGC